MVYLVSDSAFTVSGTTIKNIDPTKSCAKVLRKPAETLATSSASIIIDPLNPNSRRTDELEYFFYRQGLNFTAIANVIRIQSTQNLFFP